MGKKGAGLAVDELNFLQNRLGLGAGFNPDQFKQASPLQPGVGAPADEEALRAALLQSVGGDAAGGGATNDIIQRLLGLQTTAAGQPNLATLDPGAQSSLNAITQANQEKLNLQRQESQNQLTQNLFGSGLGQSTIALDQAGRLNYGNDALQAQLLGDAGQRELGLRNSVSDRALQSLGLQGNVLGTAGDLSGRDASLRSGMLDSALNRGFNRDATNAGFVENERQRGFNQDQFRSQLLAGLGQQTASAQGTRQNPWMQVANAGLSLAGAAMPGGGTAGGGLLSKLGGLFKKKPALGGV